MSERAVSPVGETMVADEVQPSVVGASSVATVVAGRYEILGLVGVGGMGRVYRAHDRKLGVRVALKVLHPEFVELLGRVTERAAAVQAAFHGPPEGP